VAGATRSHSLGVAQEVVPEPPAHPKKLDIVAGATHSHPSGGTQEVVPEHPVHSRQAGYCGMGNNFTLLMGLRKRWFLSLLYTPNKLDSVAGATRSHSLGVAQEVVPDPPVHSRQAG
jgi:hypothetical protein